MAYQALYRKWRPATFDEIVGQDAAAGTLKNQIRTGRIGHAYLFCGTRGCGKTSLAKIVARAVNCPEALQHDGNPCNACASCRSVLSGSSMNVFEIDAASNNGVDNIRDIREQVEYPPTEGRYKVYIIDEVHMLSAGAFNALLKTLEEPPAYVIFILATTDPQKVPATILSRCQRYDFRRMTKAAILSQIAKIRAAEGFELEDRAAEYIADAADGSMRDGLSILDQCLAYAKGGVLTYEKVLEVLGAADMSVFSDLYRALCGSNAGRALEIVSEAVAAGKEAGLLISDFIWYLRNVLLCQATKGGETVLEVTEDSLARIREDAALEPQGELIRKISALAELQNRARFAPRKRVLLEVELIRLASPVQAAPQIQMPQIEVSPGAGRFPAGIPAADPAGREPAGRAAQGQAAAGRGALSGNTGAGTAQQTEQPFQGRADRRETAGQQQAASPAETGAGQTALRPEGEEPATERQSHIGAQLAAVQENWERLLAGLSPANRVLFQDVVLREERGGILVIFKNRINFTLASRNEENGLLKLRSIAFSQLGINVNFLARVALKDEFPAEKPVITDEDLAKIHFPVTVEG